MSTTLRFTTFNVENLFNRYAFLDTPWEDRDYEQFIQAVGVVSLASREGDLVPYAITEFQRNNTALAILDAKPDFLAVEEVENIYSLRNFNTDYLDDYFEQIILLDGNDPRGIDVGLMIKRDIKRDKKELKSVEVLNIRTHVDDAKKGTSVTRRSVPKLGYIVSGAIFSRDCLEVDILVETKTAPKTLTLLINHLKAQDSKPKQSDAKRKLQAERVADLVSEATKAGKSPIVMGDLNVSPKSTTIAALLNHPNLFDPYAQFPADDVWTHYYASEKTVSRLDYILPHKSLTVKTIDPKNNSFIVRKGLTTKCRKYTGERYGTVGPMHTEASDHCPTSLDIDL